MHLIFSIIAASSSLIITKNSDISSNYPAKIKAFFIISSASRLTPARAIDRFSAVYSVFAKFFS
jgi:hypothetical protein